MPCSDKTLLDAYNSAFNVYKKSYDFKAIGDEKNKIGLALDDLLKKKKDTKTSENQKKTEEIMKNWMEE